MSKPQKILEVEGPEWFVLEEVSSDGGMTWIEAQTPVEVKR